jgi:peptide/nickel transport system ATP-binding protein/oligopeptide transport system ATP-binding protein
MPPTDNNKPLLRIKNLDVFLNTSSGPINVVNKFDLNIKKGMIFGLAGESGCGKSVTALSIMGILPSSMYARGSIEFKGTDLLKLGAEELRRLRGNEISMIFQEPMTSLNPVLRVGYQIGEVLRTHLRVTKKEALSITQGLMRAVHIPAPEHRVREYPHQMSGGMRQRIMMAMAIACSPGLLIADEPTTALDVTIQTQILDLLRELKQERDMSVLLITHDLGIIAENAEMVAIMYAGRIVEQSRADDLFASPMHPYTRGLLDSLPHGRGKSLRPIPGSVPVPGALPDGCKFSDRCSFVISECHKEEPPLTDTGSSSAVPHLVRCIRAGEV